MGVAVGRPFSAMLTREMRCGVEKPAAGAAGDRRQAVVASSSSWSRSMSRAAVF